MDIVGQQFFKGQEVLVDPHQTLQIAKHVEKDSLFSCLLAAADKYRPGFALALYAGQYTIVQLVIILGFMLSIYLQALFRQSPTQRIVPFLPLVFEALFYCHGLLFLVPLTSMPVPCVVGAFRDDKMGGEVEVGVIIKVINGLLIRGAFAANGMNPELQIAPMSALPIGHVHSAVAPTFLQLVAILFLRRMRFIVHLSYLIFNYLHPCNIYQKSRNNHLNTSLHLSP
jgi:hypothetical protein